MNKNADLSAQGRSQTIDAVKGAAILLVMAGHVLVWNHMEDPYIYDVIKVIQMPLFIMVSGYLCGAGRRVKDLGGYIRIMKKRAIAYLTPFFFWIVLLHPRTPLSSIKTTLFDLDEGLWFLMTLFLLTWMIYTAQLAESCAGRFKKAAFWTVYLALTAFVVLETFFGVEFLSPGLTRLYLPFYLTGYLAGEHKELLQKIPAVWKNVTGALSLAALLLMAAFLDLQDVGTLLLLGRQIVASFLGCCAVCWIFSVGRKGRAEEALAFVGKYTLEIYVLHFHFATVLNQGKAYELYTWEGMLFAVLSFAAMSLITAVLIIVTKKFRILDFLLYGKTQKKTKG